MRLSTSLLFAALLLTGCAPNAYDAYDVDSDRALDQNELASGLFSEWDTDDDDFLSEDEWGAADADTFGEEWSDFGVWDQNDDALLSGAEFEMGFETTDTFTEWDADADGFLSDDELSDIGVF